MFIHFYYLKKATKSTLMTIPGDVLGHVAGDAITADGSDPSAVVGSALTAEAGATDKGTRDVLADKGFSPNRRSRRRRRRTR